VEADQGGLDQACTPVILKKKNPYIFFYAIYYILHFITQTKKQHFNFFLQLPLKVGMLTIIYFSY